MFQTRRTTLRAYTPGDLPILLSSLNNPLIQNTLTSGPVVPHNHRFAAKIEEMVNEALLYVIIEATPSISIPTSQWSSIGLTNIGAASITTTHVKNRDVSLSICIDPRVWNQGFATEVTTFLVDYAFNNLAVHRISLEVLDNNHGAIKAFNKVGFMEEGRKRKANFFNGKWQDSIYMGILEEEWFSKSSATAPQGNT